MLGLSFKRKWEFMEPCSFHTQVCKLTVATTQESFSVPLLVLGINQGKPTACLRELRVGETCAEVRCWDQSRRATGKGRLPFILFTLGACLLSLHFPSFYLSSFVPSLSPHPDVRRTEPESLQNRCTVPVNVSPPLMLTGGKITKLWLCISARGRRVFTLTSSVRAIHVFPVSFYL